MRLWGLMAEESCGAIAPQFQDYWIADWDWDWSGWFYVYRVTSGRMGPCLLNCWDWGRQRLDVRPF